MKFIALASMGANSTYFIMKMKDTPKTPPKPLMKCWMCIEKPPGCMPPSMLLVVSMSLPSDLATAVAVVQPMDCPATCMPHPRCTQYHQAVRQPRTSATPDALWSSAARSPPLPLLLLCGTLFCSTHHTIHLFPTSSQPHRLPHHQTCPGRKRLSPCSATPPKPWCCLTGKQKR